MWCEVSRRLLDSAHERLEQQRVFRSWNETFCFKWQRAHGRLFHRSVFPNATCFIFCAVRWLAVAMEHVGTYLIARTSGIRTTTNLRLPFQASAHMDFDFQIFE
jgi:hypothetical protein